MKRCFRGNKILKVVINFLLPYLCLKSPKSVSAVISNGRKSLKNTIDLKSFYIAIVSSERKKKVIVLISSSDSQGVYNSEWNHN